MFTYVNQFFVVMYLHLFWFSVSIFVSKWSNVLILNCLIFLQGGILQSKNLKQLASLLFLRDCNISTGRQSLSLQVQWPICQARKQYLLNVEYFPSNFLKYWYSHTKYILTTTYFLLSKYLWKRLYFYGNETSKKFPHYLTSNFSLPNLDTANPFDLSNFITLQDEK